MSASKQRPHNWVARNRTRISLGVIAAILVIVVLSWLFFKTATRPGDPRRASNLELAWRELRRYDAVHGALPNNVVSETGQTLLSCAVFPLTVTQL